MAIDDDFPFGTFETPGEALARQIRNFEGLPGDFKSHIQDLLEGRKSPNVKEAKALIADPEELLKECDHGYLWFYIRHFEPSLRTVARMSPVLFAMMAGDYKAADKLLTMKEFKDFMRTGEADFFTVERNSKEGTYSLKSRDNFRNDDFYKFALGRYLYSEGNEKGIPVMHKFFKSFDKAAEPGWITPPGGVECPVLADNGKLDKIGGSLFGFMPNDRMYDPFLNLLEYICDNDKDLISHMFSKEAFAELFMYYCATNIPYPENSKLRVLKKIYKTSGMDFLPNDMWMDVFTRVFNNEYFTLGYEDHYDDIRKAYEKITGNDLVFNPNDIGFEWQEGCFDMRLLEAVIRIANHAVHGCKDIRSYCIRIDHESLIEYGGEELILAALKKDFIEASDCNGLFKTARALNRCSLIPLLMLKKYGEWPPKE